MLRKKKVDMWSCDEGDQGPSIQWPKHQTISKAISMQVTVWDQSITNQCNFVIVRCSPHNYVYLVFTLEYKQRRPGNILYYSIQIAKSYQSVGNWSNDYGAHCICCCRSKVDNSYKTHPEIKLQFRKTKNGSS